MSARTEKRLSAKRSICRDLPAKNPMLDAKAIADELALVKEACRTFDFKSFREGHLTPVFFGSALKNFGVKDLLDALASFAPAPRAQVSNVRTVDAHENCDDGLRLQDPGQHGPEPPRPHRLRAALLGQTQARHEGEAHAHGKPMTLSTPQFFFAQDRALADEAYAGDVVGIPNHGTLRIGDTLTEGEDIAFLGVPNFAPEILRRVKLGDPMKAKKLKEALQQMAEEGVVQVFRPLDGAPALVGVVGPLQLDVLKVRLRRNTASTSASSSRNFNWRAGSPRTMAKSSKSSCRPIIRVVPKTSTATRYSWRATSSSSTTRASARPG